MEKELEEVIYMWIYKHFGESEAEDPCYNIELLAKEICKVFELKIREEYIIEGEE